ncbi:MAG TPA: hypothetical protein VIC55_08345 [Gemmatimonadaceae bacterium]
MKRGPLIAIIAVVGFIGFLLWSTLDAQHVQCHACVDFNGQHNCADASASTQKEASRSAQSTACGTIARGMDQSIACSNRQPALLRCQTRS